MPVNYDSKSEYIWVSSYDAIPDVCCTCGLFTDHRVTIKHSGQVTKKSGGGGGAIALAIVLNLFLGPLGWIISALLEGTDDGSKGSDGPMKSVKQKIKIKIAQCRLCHGEQTPEVIDSRPSPKQLLLLVHPTFKQRFESMEPSQQ